ncbi:GNAT family N-acetyltransferase [Aestuariibaculum suncheonense]|uniref:GNAT family N-acetyltransferase n=1 Tax=Aestuariibaculum suncheonense TaxID=1028745 RepID=A0A8J6Q9Z4_9FLAO|nr:GNAT family N-acetyltransferase [Aestuariibaculum suncheonense]MBD0836407.1 GNAT family N-acetyltransferase [Aestuariibaculum suncheonense]
MSDIFNYEIKIISAQETIPVRHPVLRPGKPIETCNFEGDNLNTTFHLGIYINQQIVGVVSYFKSSTNLLTETSQYQLRGMAVLTEYQGKGLGNLLVQHGDILLKAKKTNIVWCNAREIAIPFYKKNNFNIIGEPFNIGDIGLHYVMYKSLE